MLEAKLPLSLPSGHGRAGRQGGWPLPASWGHFRIFSKVPPGWLPSVLGILEALYNFSKVPPACLPGVLDAYWPPSCLCNGWAVGWLAELVGLVGLAGWLAGGLGSHGRAGWLAGPASILETLWNFSKVPPAWPPGALGILDAL